MNLTSLKTFVISVINPSLWSLKFFYKAKYEDMVKLVDQQNKQLLDFSTQLTDLKEQVIQLQAQIVGYETEVHEINNRAYSDEQVKQLEQRERELNYICGTLYDKVYELIQTGTVEDPTLPDFEHPELPDDTQNP